MLGQEIPQTSIPFSEVQKLLGVELGKDFALVYKGDTLAAQLSDSVGSVHQLFDEEIRYFNHGDSIEYQYSLPYSFGVYRVSLPDSTLLYLKETWLYGDTTERVVRYEANGLEKYRLDRKGKNKTITHSSSNSRNVVTINEKGWSRKHEQFEPDSSFYASYSLDSVLISSWFSNESTNGEKINGSTNEFSSTPDLTRNYNDGDSSYYFTCYPTTEGGLRITEEFRKKYSEYTYECKEWSWNQDFGFEQRYTNSEKDSTYGYSSFGQGSFFVTIENDSLKVSKSYALNGDLIYRKRIDKLKGRYLVEEEMSKRDTFYHFINYYHLLDWENDTDYITSYYPFANRVFLNEDSVKIKEYKYEFGKEHEWPIVSIIEGDSNTNFKATSQDRFEYGSPIILICGERGPPRVVKIQKIDYSSAQLTGALKKRSKGKVMSFLDDCKFLELGIGWPPVYFMHIAEKDVLSSMQPYTEDCKESLKTVLNKRDHVRAILYHNGNKRKVNCSLFRLNYKLKEETRVFR